MATRNLGYGVLTVLLVSATLCGTLAAEDRLSGAWKFHSDSFVSPDTSWARTSERVGLRLFATGRYSVTIMDADRPLQANPYPDWRATDEEMLANYERILANSGSYVIRDSSVAFHVEVAKWPNLVGQTLGLVYVVQGDTLRLWHHNPPWQPDATYSETWVRAGEPR